MIRNGEDVPFDMDMRRRCWGAGNGGMLASSEQLGLKKGGPKANLDLESASRGPVHCLELSGYRGRKGHPLCHPWSCPLRAGPCPILSPSIDLATRSQEHLFV